MRKKINGAWYDTKTSTLISETESMTSFSGHMTVQLYKSQSGRWFQYISPQNGKYNRAISKWISPNTARGWLEKHGFNLHLREYFGTPGCRLLPDRQVLIAEKNSYNPTNPHDLIQVEKLYHHPQKGWCLKQTKESTLIPLTAQEAASIVKSLRSKKGHMQTPMTVFEQYLYEDEQSGHRRVAAW